MTNCLIKLTPRTNIIHSCPTFDALLAVVVYGITKDVEKAHNELPLLRTDDGLWHASSPMFEGFAKGYPIKLISKFEPVHIGDRWKYMKMSKWTNAKVTEHGNVANIYDTYSAKNVWYSCVATDVAQLSALLAQVTHLGKKHQNAGATISECKIYKGRGGDGLVDKNGTVLRPIPVDIAPKSASASNIIAHHAWKPAYWNKDNHAKCYIPQFSRNWTTDEMEELL